MALLDLDEEELAIVGQCLRAAVEGPFFPDWEFQTLIGVSREEIQRLALSWPSRDADDAGTTNAVVGVLNNLIGYPHGEESAWASFIGVGPAAVSIILEKILTQPQGR
jgi:hypothetical protein